MGARPAAWSWYTPGPDSPHPAPAPSPPWSQPLLGDGVLRASCTKLRSGTPQPPAPAVKAVSHGQPREHIVGPRRPLHSPHCSARRTCRDSPIGRSAVLAKAVQRGTGQTHSASANQKTGATTRSFRFFVAIPMALWRTSSALSCATSRLTSQARRAAASAIRPGPPPLRFRFASRAGASKGQCQAQRQYRQHCGQRCLHRAGGPTKPTPAMSGAWALECTGQPAATTDCAAENASQNKGCKRAQASAANKNAVILPASAKWRRDARAKGLSARPHPHHRIASARAARPTGGLPPATSTAQAGRPRPPGRTRGDGASARAWMPLPQSSMPALRRDARAQTHA